MDGLLSNERELLARMIQAEAGNQGEIGMRAVASVMENRRRAQGYGGNTFRDVLLAPGQFSPANSITGYAGGEQGVDLRQMQPSETAYSIADAAIAGQLEDPTGGALNFLNPAISQPSWMSSMQNAVKIGDHLFGTAGSGEGVTGRPGGTNMARQPQPVSGMAAQGQASSQTEEEKVPFFRRPAVGNALDSLAIALQGMTLNPNEGLIQLSAGRIADRREAAQTAQQRNRTVEALKQMGADSQLIQLAESGYADAALKEAIRLRRGAEPTKGVEIGDRLVNPITGEVIADFASDQPQYDPKDVANARKEFTGLKPVKDFADQTSAYGRILSSVEDPSPAGDLSLIFNYMKVLDPGSTVREGEFATAQNAGGVDQRVRGLYNRIQSGERLAPEQRADFADRATRLYQGAEQQYQSLAQQYASFAEASGLPVEQVIPDFGYSGDLYQTPIEFQRPPPPAGITTDDWAAAWSNMSDEERRQFINGGQ